MVQAITIAYLSGKELYHQNNNFHIFELSFLSEYFPEAIASEKRFMLPIDIANADNIINEAIK